MKSFFGYCFAFGLLSVVGACAPVYTPAGGKGVVMADPPTLTKSLHEFACWNGYINDGLSCSAPEIAAGSAKSYHANPPKTTYIGDPIFRCMDDNSAPTGANCSQYVVGVYQASGAKMTCYVKIVGSSPPDFDNWTQECPPQLVH